MKIDSSSERNKTDVSQVFELIFIDPPYKLYSDIEVKDFINIKILVSILTGPLLDVIYLLIFEYL